MKDLKLNLIVEALDRATAPLRKVAGALSGIQERTEKLSHAMHKLGLAEFIGGAFFTGAALEAGKSIFELTNKVAEFGETALINSKKANISVEEYLRWSWAAKQLGVDTDSLAHSFGMMEVHVGNAIKGVKASADALKLAGISMKEIRSLQGDPGALFGRIIEGLQSIKSPAAQAVAAQGLFSRGWIEMAPLLKAPREEIAALMDQLKRAHFSMTTEDTQASHEFVVAKANMGLAVQGLAMRIGDALIPKLTNAIDKITDWIESLSDDAVKQFADAVGKLADQFVQALPTIQKLVVKAVDLTDKLLKLCDNTNALKLAFMALAGILTAQAVVAVVSTGASIVGVGAAALRTAGLIFSLIPAVTGLTDVMGLLDIAMDANPIGLVALAITALIGVVALLVAGFLEFRNHWDDTVKSLEDGCASIEKAFAGFESHLPPWLRTALNAGGIALGVQFPGLGALALGIDAVAHAPRPGGHPAHAIHVPAGRGAAAHLAPAGNPSHGSPVALRPRTVADPAVNRRANTESSTAGAASGLIGTIVVKAEPGTKVTKMSSSGAVEFQHTRGVFPG